MQENNNTENSTNTTGNANPMAGGIENFKTMNPTKKLAVIGIMVGMASVMIFILFFTGNDSSSNKKPVQNEIKIDTPPAIDIQTTKNVYTQKAESEANILNEMTNNIGNLKPPTPPVLEQPKVDITPPPPSITPIQVESKADKPQLPLPTQSINDKNAKIGPTISSTSVMAFGGSTNSDEKTKTEQKTDAFLGFDGGMIDDTTLKTTSAQTTVATKINNDLRYTLVQGKVIDAVLETAINTQMSSGVIRAIISRDIYGEHSDLVLVPKGSRLVGGYSTNNSKDTNNGVITRVYATWKRIITPSGVDINLPDTPATDPLGRNGIPGYLDTNLSNNLTNAFLVSILGPYLVAKASGISNEKLVIKEDTGSGSGSGNNNNNNAVISSVGAQILRQGTQQFQDISKSQLDKIYPPGVVVNYVDQGTRIDILVQQDIVFPKQAIALQSTNLP